MSGPYIFTYLDSEITKPFRKFLSEKRYSSKELGESYRVINHWTDLGLLPDDRNESSQWRKFSIIDLVWVLIVQELREYGFPLEKIKEARSTLFEVAMSSDWPEHELEFHVFLTMIKRNVMLLVFKNGFAILMSDQDKPLQEVLTQGEETGSFLIISLNRIMEKVFPDKDFRPHFSQLAELSQEEFELINFIRFNDFKRVTVKFTNGKIQLFEGTKQESLQSNLEDIMRQDKYQKIQVVKADDKVITIERTVQEKPSQHGTNPAK